MNIENRKLQGNNLENILYQFACLFLIHSFIHLKFQWFTLKMKE